VLVRGYLSLGQLDKMEATGEKEIALRPDDAQPSPLSALPSPALLRIGREAFMTREAWSDNGEGLRVVGPQRNFLFTGGFHLVELAEAEITAKRARSKFPGDSGSRDIFAEKSSPS